MTSYNDTFNRTTSGSIGTASGGWTWSEVSLKFECNGSVAIRVSGNAPDAYTPAVSGNDNSTTVTINAASGSQPRMYVRSDASAANAYVMKWLAFASLYRLYSRVTGSDTVVTSVSAPASGTVTLTLSAVGTAIKLNDGSSDVISVTDSAVTTGTVGGIGTENDASTFDDFTFQDVGGGGGFLTALFRENAGVGGIGGGPFARANAGLGAIA